MCHVLEEDTDLGEVIPPPFRAEAARTCLAETLMIAPGHWPGMSEGWPEGRVGLLLLQGLLLRRVSVAGSCGAELLGSGDLMRESDPAGLRLGSSFQVIQPVRLAVLDGRFAEFMGLYPQLTGRVVERALRRSHNLAVNLAIVHQPRVDVRLRMFLWHLAGRWGRVRSGYVKLPLHLTQDVLADLVAARRQTVSSALSLLAKQGVVRAEPGGWLLHGEPPPELLAIARSSYEGSLEPASAA